MAEQEPAIKARRGCFFYGCLTGLFLLLLVVIAFLLGLRQVKKMVTDFTDPRPVPLPTMQMSSNEIAAVRRRVGEFRENARTMRPTQLALTAEELNALIATDPDLQPLKEKIYVTTIEGDKIKGQISILLEELDLPIFRGRYLNGIATFRLSFKNGDLKLMIEDLIVKGKPLPDTYMQKIRTQNLARNINLNPRASATLDRTESIEIKDAKLVISPKQTL
jgi:hypothetical protein